MTEQNSISIDELSNENIPFNAKQWIDQILTERFDSLQRLAQQSRKLKAFPDTEAEPAKSQYQRFRVLLEKMRKYLEMDPEIRQKTQIDKYLRQLVLDEKQFHFPKSDINAATLLLEKWEAENFGANEVKEEENDRPDGIEGEDESEDIVEPEPKRRRKSSTTKSAYRDNTSDSSGVLLPPSEHPIFGMKNNTPGIMYGIALKKGQRRTFITNPNLLRYKRSGNAYGSNGLAVGSWFAYKIMTVFRGAHNSLQGGISGNIETGAYSVVISGHYDDLDKDLGDIVYYSGSRSHENKDPQNPPESSQGTRALQASLASQRPVRVLRAASGKSICAPIVGLRYDGLYTVASTDYARNLKGGLYEQFKLVRQDGQLPIDLSRPTPKEQSDYAKVQRGYS